MYGSFYWRKFDFIYLFIIQRVKVYRLNTDGKWDDKGTGHVTVEYLEVCLFGCFEFILYYSCSAAFSA